MPKKHLDYDQAKKLYYQLRAMYNSPYADEGSNYEVIMALQDAVNNEGYNPEYIIAKMKLLLSKLNPEYKQKFHTVVLSKFWI